MNRTDLVDALARDTEESKAAIDRFLDAFIHQVQTAVARGDEVKLAGFGKFDRATVAPRAGRNPRTGEALQLSARARPRFTAGAAFKERVKAG